MATDFAPRQFQFKNVQGVADPTARMLASIAQGVMSGLDRKKADEDRAFNRALAEAKEARAQEEHEASIEERRERIGDKVIAGEEKRVAGVKASAAGAAEAGLGDVFLQKRQGEIAAALGREYGDTMSVEQVQQVAGEFAAEGLSPQEALDRLVERKAKGALTEQRAAAAKRPAGSSGGVSAQNRQVAANTNEAVLLAMAAAENLRERGVDPEEWPQLILAYVTQKMGDREFDTSKLATRISGKVNEARGTIKLGDEQAEDTPVQVK